MAAPKPPVPPPAMMPAPNGYGSPAVAPVAPVAPVAAGAPAAPPVEFAPQWASGIDPALQAALEEEMRLAGTSVFGDGRDIDWYKPARPTASSATGSQERSHILILPTPGQDIPWVKTAQHQRRHRGEFASAGCARRDARLNGVDPTQLPYCRMCAEMDARYGRARDFDKNSPDNDYWKEQGKKCIAQDRTFANVFDLDNPARHYDPSTGKFRSAVWGFSKTTLTQISNHVSQVGRLWLAPYTPLEIIATKDGKEDRNVKYDANLMVGHIQSVQLPQGYEPVLEELYELQTLRRAPSDDFWLQWIGPGEWVIDEAGGEPSTTVQVQVPSAPPVPPVPPVPSQAALPQLPQAAGAAPWPPPQAAYPVPSAPAFPGAPGAPPLAPQAPPPQAPPQLSQVVGAPPGFPGGPPTVPVSAPPGFPGAPPPGPPPGPPAAAGGVPGPSSLPPPPAMPAPPKPFPG